MATIQKSTKINFYKFVGVKSASVSSVLNPETAELTNSINTNTQAVNNLGATLNSIASYCCKFEKYTTSGVRSRKEKCSEV